MTGERILLVDDEDNLRTMLAAALAHSGFEVETATDGREALAKVPEFLPDLILLDVMMPDLDGFEVCRRLRTERVKTPVVFLTARDDTDDKVRGLTLGGDDYLVKPFSLEELVARIDAVLRRLGRQLVNLVLRCADLELDEDAHRVTRAGTEIPLSPTEFNLLRFLMTNQGRVLSPRRSSITSGTTTSTVMAASWRPTSRTSVRSSIRPDPADPDRARHRVLPPGGLTCRCGRECCSR